MINGKHRWANTLIMNELEKTWWRQIWIYERNINRNSRKYHPCMKLLKLHVPVINFDLINFILFRKTLIYHQINSWNGAVLIYNFDSVGIASTFLNHWLDTYLKPVCFLCKIRRINNFDFLYQTSPVIRTRSQPWKRIELLDAWLCNNLLINPKKKNCKHAQRDRSIV